LRGLYVAKETLDDNGGGSRVNGFLRKRVPVSVRPAQAKEQRPCRNIPRVMREVRYFLVPALQLEIIQPL